MAALEEGLLSVPHAISATSESNKGIVPCHAMHLQLQFLSIESEAAGRVLCSN